MPLLVGIFESLVYAIMRLIADTRSDCKPVLMQFEIFPSSDWDTADVTVRKRNIGK